MGWLKSLFLYITIILLSPGLHYTYIGRYSNREVLWRIFLGIIHVSEVRMSSLRIYYYNHRTVLLFTLNVNNLYFFSNGKRRYTVMVCKSLRKGFEYICSALSIYTTHIYYLNARTLLYASYMYYIGICMYICINVYCTYICVHVYRHFLTGE